MIGRSESDIRNHILGQRNALSQDDSLRLSRKVIHRFLSSPIFQAIHSAQSVAKGDIKVGMYFGVRRELDLSPLFHVFKKWGWRVSFPKIVDSAKGILEFFEVNGLPQPGAGEWKQGLYGIWEPASGSVDRPMEATELDLILVPGVVFGESGERIGMGKGYYDRYLSRHSGSLRVSLAYDFQVMPSLIQKATDQSVDWILTESREFKPASALSKFLDFERKLIDFVD